jgi:hypothetical protein
MARRASAVFTTIRTEGGLLPAELLARVAGQDKDLPGVRPAEYHLVQGELLGERITRSWNRLTGAWKAFVAAVGVLPETDAGTTLTRERWLLPMFEELGYGRLQTAKAEEADGRSYAISHVWGHAPIHLVSARVPLDRRSPGVKGAAGASPHSLVQEFLNRSTDHLWAFVSNGLSLRVLRDNASLTRQAFVEFDLETMFADEVFDDFVVLWLTCHQSRVEATNPAECWLEQWTAAAAQAGTRARDELRNGVEAAIEALGAGFVAHPGNVLLKERLRSGELSTFDYYRQLLRLVYRLLFLFVAEDRNLLHPPGAADIERRRYARFYSLGHIRSFAGRRRGGPHPDLWRSLSVVFDGLGRPDGIPELGLPGLGSFLWSQAACPDLEHAQLTNQDLMTGVRHLAFVEDRGEKVLRPVDYRNLGTEELGAVYEALLEQHPVVNADAGTFTLNTAAGHERKNTGSYYTPPPIILHVLSEALDPLLARASAKPNPEDAILDLRVIDPACGSGHFLIAAAHRIAKGLAAVRTGDAEPAPDATRTALRDVIARCIHGIDLNPMAVELCKVSLWMESMEPGKPLGFLDHRIVRGNGLIGATPELLDAGVPDDAFKKVDDDHPATVTSLKKRNKVAREGQANLFGSGIDFDAAALAQALHGLDAVPDDKLEGVQAKASRWTELINSADYKAAVFSADTWCAAFVAPKALADACITHEDYFAARDRAEEVPASVRSLVQRLADRYSFLHWHLVFPDVHQRGGFDLVLGNPPFLNQLETASSLDARAKLLLATALPEVVGSYTDLSAVFLSLWSTRLAPNGTIAMVQPISLLAARDAAGTRRHLATAGSLVSLWVADSHMFDASVYVCVPVVTKASVPAGAISRFRGARFEPIGVWGFEGSVDELETWAVIMSERADVRISSRCLGDIADVTADFRDQYYGLIPFVFEDEAKDSACPRLLTTGLVDPAANRWGSTSTRFGKQKWERPCVDLRRLENESNLGPWARARLVPKLVVASQTKVIEAVVDQAGRYLPSVPLLTVTPHDQANLWRILAALLSPYASHWAHSTFAGAGMNADAIKVSAKQLATLRLPADDDAWAAGALKAQQASDCTNDDDRRVALTQMSEHMTEAYGADPQLRSWWLDRAGLN